MASGGTPWGWRGVRNSTSKSTHEPKPRVPHEEDDPYWKNKRLNPSRMQVRDITIEDATRSPHHPNPAKSEGRLSCDDADVPDLKRYATQLDDEIIRLEENLPPMIEWEKARVNELLKDYGWMKGLRKENSPSSWRCRWIHIPSLFPDHLRGVLLSMSKSQSAAIVNCRVLEECITRNERFSRHGKYFSAFIKRFPENKDTNEPPPLLLSFPFIDWTVHPGPSPQPRHQVDSAHGSIFQSHPLRSMLQYYYRLENTSDRERGQVYFNHQPWLNDSTLTSKVQRWYGSPPTGLAVDEMWILVLDSQHIISFSSNQTWKPLWPAHQVPYRIAEIAFRTLRNKFHVTGQSESYDAFIHVLACIDGSMGLLHWSSWPDIVLCLTDRFGGYLNHLVSLYFFPLYLWHMTNFTQQYRLHRSPSTKLVMDLLQIQDELGIVLDISRKQWDLVSQVREAIYSPVLENPHAQLVANLDREFADLRDLRENCNNLVTRTVQLVNIRLEDHGKAILVFTIVTIVFLPLSFVASVFGMNTYDIRNLTRGQGIFWACALSLTAVVVAVATVMAFYGGSVIERLFELRGESQLRPRSRAKKRDSAPKESNWLSQGPHNEANRSFNVKGVRTNNHGLETRFRGA
ncbi:MAG: hypothetical protein M1814_002664 [Vezdaea aestivalis]|nr:MAG: hypothetical protein M1814_002664 [Vezdaea aestivalis]